MLSPSDVHVIVYPFRFNSVQIEMFYHFWPDKSKEHQGNTRVIGLTERNKRQRQTAKTVAGREIRNYWKNECATWSMNREDIWGKLQKAQEGNNKRISFAAQCRSRRMVGSWEWQDCDHWTTKPHITVWPRFSEGSVCVGTLVPLSLCPSISSNSSCKS